MKQNQYLLNVLLTAVLGAVMLVALLVNTFAPTLPLPRLGIPAMTLLSLIALLLEAFVVPGAERCISGASSLRESPSRCYLGRPG